MRAIASLLRGFSYLFHILLSLFLFAVSAMAYTAHVPLKLDVLPWTGDRLVYITAAAGVAGFALTTLAFFGKWRVLFLLWSLAVVVAMIRGFASPAYRFGPEGPRTALLLTAGALLALFGAWSRVRTPTGKARVYRTR